MTAPVCPHGLGTPAACVDCMDEGLLPPPAPVDRETAIYTFEAGYPGTCPVCDRSIDPGDDLAATDRDRYVHVGCVGRS